MSGMTHRGVAVALRRLPVEILGVDYELGCGHSFTLGECDELRFCPVCGAEVIKDEGIKE